MNIAMQLYRETFGTMQYESLKKKVKLYDPREWDDKLGTITYVFSDGSTIGLREHDNKIILS